MSALRTNPGFRLPSCKSAWDLVYPRQNGDVRESLIGCLEDWKIKNPVLVFLKIFFFIA